MPHHELVSLAESLLQSITPGPLSDQQIQQLHLVFQNTLVAALDIIDKGRVLKQITPYGRYFYQVQSTEPKAKGLDEKVVYDVHPQLMSTFSPSCTCPAFVYAVLLSESHLMCKHVLAVRLAEQLNRCTLCEAADDEIVDLFG